MPLRDLLKKKEKIDEALENSKAAGHGGPLPPPEFKFVRSDTYTQETISPPAFGSDSDLPNSTQAAHPSASPSRRPWSRSGEKKDDSPKKEKEHRRLSQRLHLGGNKSRSSSTSSANLPQNLPEISDAYKTNADEQETEAEWERRATILASSSPNIAANANVQTTAEDMSSLSLNEKKGRPRSISDAQSDVNIQEAIRLHEAGELEKAAVMFHQLAERGNVLSQVLYGLSLRHGWGCPVDEKKAFTYLSSAASNSAALEAEALQAGVKKGGAAKGELVLAIFELANCFRYGWGTTIDKAATRQYYETAAHLGDTDAMNEAAWCYLEGFGGKKDKFKAAQLLRLAEKNGSKTIGNTWIWKEKYNPK